MVKLNIEMSMAHLITKVAQNSVEARNEFLDDSSHNRTQVYAKESTKKMTTGTTASAFGRKRGASEARGEESADIAVEGKIGIRKQVDVKVESLPEDWEESARGGSEDEFTRMRMQSPDRKNSEDEIPLAELGVPPKKPRTEAWE